MIVPESVPHSSRASPCSNLPERLLIQPLVRPLVRNPERFLVDEKHGDGVGDDAEEVRRHAAVEGFPTFFEEHEAEGLNEGGVFGNAGGGRWLTESGTDDLRVRQRDQDR